MCVGMGCAFEERVGESWREIHAWAAVFGARHNSPSIVPLDEDFFAATATLGRRLRADDNDGVASVDLLWESGKG